MSSILYRNGVVHSPADPFAEAVLIEDGVVAWLGANDSAAGFAPRAEQVIDLDGALVTPGFVDAHVHLLSTGLAMTGLDLSWSGRGAASSSESAPASAPGAQPGTSATRAPIRSADDVLRAVAANTHMLRSDGSLGILHGHGWDESQWSSDGLPTREQLDSAGQGAPVILVRADSHSSLVSSAYAELAGLAHLDGWTPGGHITGAAHTRALDVLRTVGAERHTELTDLALTHAARSGIVAVHEMSIPGHDTREGLASLIERTAHASSGLPQVIGYRGELMTSPEDAADLLAQIPGLTGIGGDLRVDGSLGSHTAALTHPYADLTGPDTKALPATRQGRAAQAAQEAPDAQSPPGAPEHLGTLELNAEQIAQHLAAVAHVGLQAGFHVIGDAAMGEATRGFLQAAQQLPAGVVHGGAHRFEHAEMIDPESLDIIVRLGIRLSMQPAFDARWGAPGGLYATRVGAIRAAGMNPFADLAAQGVPLAFGSDTPVTPFDPWGAVRGALLHHSPDQRISARAAFRAHTRGGWRLAGLDHTGAGEIRVGSPAHLAIWRADHLDVQGPTRQFATWSTDARAGIPLLPDLSPDSIAPRCLRTVRDGHILHDELA